MHHKKKTFEGTERKKRKMVCDAKPKKGDIFDIKLTTKLILCTDFQKKTSPAAPKDHTRNTNTHKHGVTENYPPKNSLTWLTIMLRCVAVAATESILRLFHFG